MKHKPSHLFVVCWASLAVACGAGDNRLDPADLELRDLLGIAPETAMLWDTDQREAARRVIDEAMRHGELAEHRAALAKDERIELDRKVTRAIADVDAQRAGHGVGAVGVAQLAVGGNELIARMRASSLEPGVEIDVRLDGWVGKPWAFLAERNRGVIAKLATDAGHTGGPLAVAPMPRLAAGAVYLRSPSPRLLVNPVVLAALEPPVEASPTTATTTTAAAHRPPAPTAKPPGKLGSIVLFPAPGTPTTPGGKPATAALNPYNFYQSIGACATDQRARCVSCVPTASCLPITDMTDGNEECAALGAGGERGFSLVCINLALAIDAVASCTQGRAPQCPQDVRASDTFAALENNARFFDDTACGQPLDACLVRWVPRSDAASTDRSGTWVRCRRLRLRPGLRRGVQRRLRVRRIIVRWR